MSNINFNLDEHAFQPDHGTAIDFGKHGLFLLWYIHLRQCIIDIPQQGLKRYGGNLVLWEVARDGCYTDVSNENAIYERNSATPTIHIHTTVEHNGEVYLSDLPIKHGQVIDLHIHVVPVAENNAPTMTARQLAESDVVGIWQDRNDIGDSGSFARHLRAQAQRR